MADNLDAKDRKRRRNGDIVHELDEITEFSDIKKLKISAGEYALRTDNSPLF
jgi:hypothetical protein